MSVTRSTVTKWADGFKASCIEELRCLINDLNDDLHRLETDDRFYGGDEHPLRYRQFCEALNQMKTIARMRDYVPQDIA